MAESSLTQDYIKSILNYDPETGIFTWKVKVARCIEIDDEAGWLGKRGYRRIMINNSSYRSSRLAFLYMTGKIPIQVDHENQIRDDNKWLNLRPATDTINMMNKTLYKNNTSGCTGIYWLKREGKWASRITLNKKSIQIYYGDDLFEAACIRKSAIIRHGYHENHGNHKCLT